VTIDEVARMARVSPATVSRVLNGTSPVSDDKGTRVRHAVAALGYEPFGPARALRHQRVRVWAVVITDVENPFFTSVTRGIEDAAHAGGYRLVLCNSDENPDKEGTYVDIAIRERMAGVVIAVAASGESKLDRLIAHGIPVVAIDRRPNRDIDSVVVDNRGGARAATEHLIECGWQRIACITGPSRTSTSTERAQGYRNALRAAGRTVDPSLVRRADYRQEGGYRAARALLESSDPPDALFVANNLMTVGALQAIHDLGIRVPDELGIVGFDDSPWAELIKPRLTVVAQPTYEIGRTAAELLTTHTHDEPPRHVVLSPTLIVRESSQRPGHASASRATSSTKPA
jgi:LacI family transcriptional regulator